MINHRAGPEDEKQRIDRELMELLQELRVAVVGIQVLFAFLLTVPFTLRFETVTTFQRDTYFVTLLLAALSSVFLIAPSAQHRVLFRQKDKAQLLMRSNVLSLIGLVFLALAITGVVLLITDLLFSSAAVVVVSAGIAVLFVLFWFAQPLTRRREKHHE
jgi:O-antigen/teichoic acid export membrane protein